MSYQNPNANCENCNSHTWQLLSDCAGCGAPSCDCCAIPVDVERNGRTIRTDLYCSTCVKRHQEEIYCAQCGCSAEMVAGDRAITAEPESIVCCQGMPRTPARLGEVAHMAPSEKIAA
jgi:hypothetical protein